MFFDFVPDYDMHRLKIKILSWHASAVKLFNNLSFLKTKKRFICKHMLGIK